MGTVLHPSFPPLKHPHGIPRPLAHLDGPAESSLRLLRPLQMGRLARQQTNSYKPKINYKAAPNQDPTSKKPKSSFDKTSPDGAQTFLRIAADLRITKIRSPRNSEGLEGEFYGIIPC